MCMEYYYSYSCCWFTSFWKVHIYLLLPKSPFLSVDNIFDPISQHKLRLKTGNLFLKNSAFMGKPLTELSTTVLV